jgi:hypothetical protein
MNSDLSFLWFKPTKEIAWTQMLSPVMTQIFRGQLHFLPQDPKPYIQVTQSGTSITVNTEDYDVYILDCNDEAFEINDHVDLNSYTDDSGVKQLYIRLKYLPLDYGMNYVCLKIVSTVSSIEYVWYSNPFLLTNLLSNHTIRLDYRETRSFTETPLYNSARISMYRNDYVSATDLTTYYQITKQQNVISRVNKKRYLQWSCEKMDSWHWVRLEEALYNSPCYFNFIRNYPAEALDFEARLGNTNMNQQFLITDPNEKDVINIPSIIIETEIEYVPMLASTDVLASTDQIVSEIETPVP